MTPIRFLRVRNFEKFQSFNFKNLKHDPKPPWIKVYHALLGDRAFFYLPDASKFHVMGLFLIASQHDNHIPADARWIQHQMGATEPVDLELLLELRFLEWEADIPTTPPLKEILEKVKKEVSDVSPLEERNYENSILVSHKRREEKSREEKKEPLAIASPEPKYSDEFQEFWMASTRRGSKPEAAAAWKALRPDSVLQAQIRAGMSAWQASEQWQDETKQPHVHRWIKRRGWDEEVPRKPEKQGERYGLNVRAAQDFVSRKLAETVRGDLPDVRKEPG